MGLSKVVVSAKIFHILKESWEKDKIRMQESEKKTLQLGLDKGYLKLSIIRFGLRSNF